jgi:hypothetical protein
MFTILAAGGVAVVTKGDDGDEDPSVKDTDPPALPLSVTVGPFSKLICVPGAATISKLAAPKT